MEVDGGGSGSKEEKGKGRTFDLVAAMLAYWIAYIRDEEGRGRRMTHPSDNG